MWVDDNLNGWPNQPSTAYFRGAIDEFAVYGSALTTAQITNHYQIGKGPHLPPVAVIAQEAAGQSVTFSGKGSTASGDADLQGYAWSFGDGATSTEATPTHKYATAGTYTVSLTVTDSQNSISQLATKPLTVGAPDLGCGEVHPACARRRCSGVLGPRRPDRQRRLGERP